MLQDLDMREKNLSQFTKEVDAAVAERISTLEQRMLKIELAVSQIYFYLKDLIKDLHIHSDQK